MNSGVAVYAAKATLAANDMAELWDRIIAVGLVHVLALEANSLPAAYLGWFDAAPR